MEKGKAVIGSGRRWAVDFTENSTSPSSRDIPDPLGLARSSQDQVWESEKMDEDELKEVGEKAVVEMAEGEKVVVEMEAGEMDMDSRVRKAFNAMKSIGIHSNKVKPVLKNLLKLYDKNWELIEEDNYRTLADAIFEHESDEMVKKNDVPDPEPPYKKARGTTIEDQGSSNFCGILDLGEGEIPQCSDGEKLAESSQSFSANPRAENPGSISNEGCVDEVYPCKTIEKVHELHRHGNVNKHEKTSPFNCLHLSSLTSPDVSSDEHKQHGGFPWYSEGSLQYTFDIASSSCGQVKLCFRHNHAIGQPSSQSPNIEAVLKYAEEKSMNLGPKLSMTQLMKEICDSYLKLGADSDSRSLPSRSPSGCLDRQICSKIESRRSRTINLENGVNKKVSNYSSTSSSPKIAVVCHDKKTQPKIHDITNGTEEVIIPLLDETGREHVPKFVYIPQNIIYQSAYVHVSMARIADEDCCTGCTGDCLSSSISCACARDTGGEFAYTPEGLLRQEFLSVCISMKAEPQRHFHFYCNDCPLERAKNDHAPEKCKGHLLRKFIKECWRKCQCNMKCGNRVVQRGITRKLQVFLTDEGKGWGLRALEELPKGAFICEYVGEILTNMELYERNKQSSGRDRHTYPVLLDADWGSERVLMDEEALCLDATHYGNVARFINHRCFDANLIEIPVEVETPDHHYYHIAFFTTRKVEAFEELTWDYGIDFDDDNHPIEAFLCSCGSAYCRDKKAKRGKAIVLQ